MSYQRGSANPPPSASIRAGLSVQELKAMTAMRMATNEPRGYSNAARVPPMNSASSYQTATPQQLQAAGIQHVALNGQSSRNTKLSPTYGGATRNDEPSLYSYARASQTPSTLSPYHQQILSGSNKTTIPPVQSVQELKALTQMRSQKRSNYGELLSSSRAELVLHGGNPSTQYASAISTRPARPSNLQPLYGGDFEEGSGSNFAGRYQQQQQQQQADMMRAKQLASFNRVSNIPVTSNLSNSDDEDSDYALNKMLADYEQTSRSRDPRDELTLNLAGTDQVASAYTSLLSPTSTASSEDADPQTPTSRAPPAQVQAPRPSAGSFSESFGALSMLDREVAMRQSQQHVTVGTRPMKLGAISKSQSQPLIPLANGGGLMSPTPALSRKHAPTFLPELDNSPHTSRENTPKQPASLSPYSGLYSEQPASTVGGNGLFPLIKSRSQTRITGAASPSLDFSVSSRRGSTLGEEVGGSGDFDGMAESVIDFLNTPTPGSNGKSFFGKAEEYRQFAGNGINLHKPVHRQQPEAASLTVTDLLGYPDASLVDAAPGPKGETTNHHNNNEDDEDARFELLSRQSSNSEFNFNGFSPRYANFE